jgi:hypothetical protein
MDAVIQIRSRPTHITSPACGSAAVVIATTAKRMAPYVGTVVATMVPGCSSLERKSTPHVTVLRDADPGRAMIEAAADYDLIVLGLRIGSWGRREVGGMVLRIAREVPCAAIILGRRRGAIW